MDRLKLLNLPSLVYRRLRGDMIEVYKFCHSLYTVGCDILIMANNSITRGQNLKLTKLHNLSQSNYTRLL